MGGVRTAMQKLVLRFSKAITESSDLCDLRLSIIITLENNYGYQNFNVLFLFCMTHPLSLR
jgi:hypothetical protein